MLRDKPEDAEVLAYCEALRADLGKQAALGMPLRTHVDVTQLRSADKRWNWVRRGAPLILEIGPRDAAGGQVTFMRRDALRNGEKIASEAMARDAFVSAAPGLLVEIQQALFVEAKQRLDESITSNVTDFEALKAYFAGAEEDEDKGGAFKGWVRVPWSRPTGDALEAVANRLKALKLTIRNAPLAQPKAFGKCIFTGAPGVEEILVARAY